MTALTTDAPAMLIAHSANVSLASLIGARHSGVTKPPPWLFCDVVSIPPPPSLQLGQGLKSVIDLRNSSRTLASHFWRTSRALRSITGCVSSESANKLFVDRFDGGRNSFLFDCSLCIMLVFSILLCSIVVFESATLASSTRNNRGQQGQRRGPECSGFDIKDDAYDCKHSLQTAWWHDFVMYHSPSLSIGSSKHTGHFVPLGGLPL
mmetsp:Transcript_15718/g.33957  ORF Transcript_15718/g.33957 Transcript_15718/m.33957 type:complete len:207 (+) Transcript_15718:2377-2997(+)